MTIEEIIQQPPDKAIQMLTEQGKDTRNHDITAKQWDVKRHEINDHAARPDKEIKGDKGTITRIEPVARIALALQKLIVKRAVSFMFGNPVKITSEPEEGTQTDILEAVKRIIRDNKTNSFNRRIAKEVFAYTEAAELWFPVEKKVPHKKYGFTTKWIIKNMILSPARGDELYPLFDETGDMVAFSRKYTQQIRNAEGKITHREHLTTYTADRILEFIKTSEGWQEPEVKENVLGKIPIVYHSQEASEWADVQTLIERLEKLLSNFADTNDYHASPKIFIQGNIIGFAKKGESGAIIQGDTGSTAQYLSWQHAPESVRLEIDTLLRMINTITQTPDISFDGVRGIGAIAGIALRLLFMDAHLKVHDKLETWEDTLTRRMNIVKHFAATLNPAWSKEADNLEMEIEVTPYILDDFRSDLEILMTASGNKPVISQATAIEQSGFVSDPARELERIKEENHAANIFDVFEPAQ